MIRIISESLEYQRVAVFVHILPKHTNSIFAIDSKLLEIPMFSSDTSIFEGFYLTCKPGTSPPRKTI